MTHHAAARELRRTIALTALLLLLTLLHHTKAAGQQLSPEHPIGADAHQYLTNLSATWTVSSTRWGVSIAASVPGDLLSDLASGAIIRDPWFELTWLNTTTLGHQGAPIWDVGNWTYETSFDLDATILPAWSAGATLALVLDGVKMAADVSLNGAHVASVVDQFLRSVVLLPGGLLTATGNTLCVTFTTSRDPRNRRFSGVSGGWDFAAYTATSTVFPAVGRASQLTLSKGIWRDIYLAAILPRSAAIEHVSPLIRYDGPYPTQPLSDANAGPWTVTLKVVLNCPSVVGSSGVLSAVGDWPGGAATTPLLHLERGVNIFFLNLTAAVGAVRLWWPRGLGTQQLFNVNLTWMPAVAPATPVISTRRIGFRVIYIVTSDDSSPASQSGRDGSGNLTMRWKVNGADIWARGADVIPMEALEGRQSDIAYRALIASCATANFNTLRVDGIDIIFPAVFYDACDEAGLLVYHDLQYSQGNPAPQNSTLEADELVHTARKLAHHPSLALVDACNECGGHGIYASFVMTTYAEEDSSRPPWPASPSNGWLSGVDRLTGLPNGSPLGLQPTMTEQHAPYSRGVLPPPLALIGTGTVPSFSHTTVANDDGASNCTYLPDLDLCPGDPECLKLPHPSVATESACCSACASAGPSSCGSSVFYQGVCWFKPQNATTPVYAAGRMLCWPPGRPIPPLPTPGPMPTPSRREQHGPYQYGTGWPAVNGASALSLFAPNMPPELAPTYTIGAAVPGFFVSEFGCVAGSSFESLSPTLAPEHWSLHGGMPSDSCVGRFANNCTGASGLPTNPMAQRNYPLDSIIGTYFGTAVLPSLDDVGAAALQRQTYFGQLGPALQQKAAIEVYRGQPIWGLLYWDVNEVWPTTGWGSIEYGPLPSPSVTPGQVVGGRWKPLHYWLVSLFADVFSACGADGRCYARNDSPMGGFSGVMRVEVVSVRTGAAMTLSTTRVNLGRGAGAIAWTCMLGNGSAGQPCASSSSVLAEVGCAPNGSDCAVRSTLVGNGTDAAAVAVSVAPNLQFQAPPSALAFAQGVTVTTTVGAVSPDGSSIPVNITVAGGAALFVTLTTLAQGRFSDNALPLVPVGVVTVYFVPMLAGLPLNATLLASSLRVEHLGAYLQPARGS